MRLARGIVEDWRRRRATVGALGSVPVSMLMVPVIGVRAGGGEVCGMSSFELLPTGGRPPPNRFATGAAASGHASGRPCVNPRVLPADRPGSSPTGGEAGRGESRGESGQRSADPPGAKWPAARATAA